VAGATRLVARVSSAALDSGVHFPRKFFIIVGAFASGQVLNFGSLAYVTECYGELHPFNGATLASNELSVPPPPLVLLGADLEVLAQQIGRVFGFAPLHVGLPLDVLHAGQHPPPDGHRRGAPATRPLLVLPLGLAF
jgi:hypothetical protein